MLNLYIKTGCPYCLRVLEANETIKAPLVLRNISENPQLREELIEKGGKAQAPYLEDTDRGVSMYESLDIIEYLKVNYGNGETVEIKTVGNVCPID
ncbi:glutathione S-transferase N-terminal domain-containing protein [Patescibacteria group bacterium]|nr:glutathione S-transferase N-terminal domain-containing protein [Patescibacteria group bacterium]